jgi:hypothetical protein
MPVAESGLYGAKVHEGQLAQAHRLLNVRPVLTFNKPVNVRINVTLRRVRVTIVVVEKEYLFAILSVCVCSLIYPSCNAHAAYYVICGLSESTIFFHIIS